jgi:peptidoglycan hydrolase CwlO-like protein
MRRLLLFLVFCLVPTSLILMYGCGPRAEVAKKKVLDRLDDMLGKMDVQRAEIDTGIKSTKQAVEGIRKAKIKAQVKMDQLDEKAKPFEEKIGQCDQTLTRLRDLLKADKPADIAGKTYSVADLKDMAGKIIQARKDTEKEIDGFKMARENMRKVVATLGKQQQALETRLTSLQGQVAKLDAEMAAAKAMKDASASMGDKDATLAANLDSLEEKVASLSGDVRAELQSESEKFSEAKTDKAISDVDAFIRDSQKPTDTVAEIDKILGPAKK